MENVILCDKSDLIAMADRVREVTNSTRSFNVPELKEQVVNLRGEPILQKKTVSNSKDQQTIKPDEGYEGLSEVTVSFMPTVAQASPTIEVNSSTGVITATSRQPSSGYLTAGTKTTTKTLSTQSAKTITPTKSTQTAVAKGKYTIGAVTVAAIPSEYIKPTTTKAATTYTPGTANQTIASGTYCSGTQTIKGDANLVATNIAEGVSIFGVTGTHSGGIDTSDATATADDIVTGETAYINGVKVTGTNPYEKDATTTEVNTQATKLAELKTILEGKAAGGGGGYTTYAEVQNASGSYIWISLVEEMTESNYSSHLGMQYNCLTKLPVGAYIAFLASYGSFPISYTPSDSLEVIGSSGSGANLKHFYKLKADCKIYLDD